MSYKKECIESVRRGHIFNIYRYQVDQAAATQHRLLNSSDLAYKHFEFDNFNDIVFQITTYYFDDHRFHFVISKKSLLNMNIKIKDQNSNTIASFKIDLFKEHCKKIDDNYIVNKYLNGFISTTNLERYYLEDFINQTKGVDYDKLAEEKKFIKLKKKTLSKSPLDSNILIKDFDYKYYDPSKIIVLSSDFISIESLPKELYLEIDAECIVHDLVGGKFENRHAIQIKSLGKQMGLSFFLENELKYLSKKGIL